MASIKLENVEFYYEETKSTFKALDKLSLTIPDGQFICIVGESGCGKTTLLRLIAGLHRASQGNILTNDIPLNGPNSDAAIVFQDYTLFPWMTAKKNITFAMQHSSSSLSKKEINEKADFFLEKVGMKDVASKLPHQLSGGMRQRIAIARALAMDTEILLLDEPFGALDIRIRVELQNLLEELWMSAANRKTIVFVTHDIQEAVRLADRILFMKPGKIVADVPINVARPRTGLSQSELEKSILLQHQLEDFFYQNH